MGGAATIRTSLSSGRQPGCIVKSQAKGRGVEGKIYSLFGGRQYILAVFRCFKDVRIVAAPPISIGKFGGDTDNWQWPRYSADFAILRVYAG